MNNADLLRKFAELFNKNGCFLKELHFSDKKQTGTVPCTMPVCGIFSCFARLVIVHHGCSFLVSIPIGLAHGAKYLKSLFKNFHNHLISDGFPSITQYLNFFCFDVFSIVLRVQIYGMFPIPPNICARIRLSIAQTAVFC